MATLSIIIPSFNEGNTIKALLDRVRDVSLLDGLNKEVIVLNDCSSDNSEEIVSENARNNSHLNIRYFKHERNCSKGPAGEYLIIQDVDLEYNPNEYNKLLKPVLDGVADVVFGSRFVGGSMHRVLLFWHTLVNRLLTLFSNVFTNLNLTDMETCYKLFKTDVIQNIDLREQRFGIEPEITAKIARIPGIRIYEVGISYYGRTYAEGKKINWKDGIWGLRCILKYNLYES